MDPVLQALEHYRTTATPSQKAVDLNQLEKECLSTIDAYQYVCEVFFQNSGCLNQQKLFNFNLDPDYNLDFSFYNNTYISKDNFKVIYPPEYAGDDAYTF